MSRILRRPMFRGGPVDSRGTGITANLGYNNGGRVGYNKGMLVQPPGASRLFNIQDILKQTGAPMTGKQIFDYAAEKGMNLGNIKLNEYSLFIPETVEVAVGTDGDIIEKPYSEILRSEGPQVYKDPNEEYLGSEDTQGSIGDKSNDGGRTFSSNFGTTNEVAKKLEKKIDDTTKIEEVSFSADADGDVTTVDENDLDSLIDRYYKQLGGDKAARRYGEDVLSTVSASLLEGKGFKGALADAVKVRSDAPKIKQAAAMLGIKGEQAQKLYETKLKNQSGQLQKAVEYIKEINPGMNDKEALATYQRRPRSLSETVGKYKKQDGAITEPGITLAAGEWFLDDYKGELPTDGNIKEGDPAVGKGDGAYTDKAKGLIFVIKDEVVTDVSRFEN
tara:strand:+ start:163 stop:1332 length:1170 start_codon:yes stop_codon:yes gene_type:complete